MVDTAPPGRRERNKAQTRRRLLAAARELIARDGAAATVEGISERAGVSRATFFNYFPSKDDLVTALYTQQMNRFAHVVDSVLAEPMSTHDRIVGLFDDFSQGSASDPEYLRAVTVEIDRISAATGAMPERSQIFTRQVRRLIEPGVAQQDIRTDHPLDFLAQMVAAIYLSTMRFWQNDPDYDVVESFKRAGRFAAESVTLPAS